MATAKTSSKKATGSAKPKKKTTPKATVKKAVPKKTAVKKAAPKTADPKAALIAKKVDKPVTGDKKTKTKLVKVKFLKSPTGAFKLSYGVGQEAQIRETLSADLIEAGYAELV